MGWGGEVGSGNGWDIPNVGGGGVDPLSGLAAIGAIGSLFGKGGGSQTTSTSTATNSLNVNFDPIIGQIGGGVAPSNSAVASPTTSTVADPTQTNPTATGNSPFPSLFNPTAPGRYDLSGLPVLASPNGSTVTGQGVAANLSGTTIILIAGIGLLLVMAMSGRRR